MIKKHVNVMNGCWNLQVTILMANGMDIPLSQTKQCLKLKPIRHKQSSSVNLNVQN
jgi:hypothetical protein